MAFHVVSNQNRASLGWPRWNCIYNFITVDKDQVSLPNPSRAIVSRVYRVNRLAQETAVEEHFYCTILIFAKWNYITSSEFSCKFFAIVVLLIPVISKTVNN